MSAPQMPGQMSLLDSMPDTWEAVDQLIEGAMIAAIDSATASRLVVAHHYLHRRPPISHAFGLYVHGKLLGTVTYGTPASRHLQKSACPSDPLFGHYGYIYRALNFHYAGWTDMDRKTPRYDYIPHDPAQHTREAFRTGYAYKRRRVAKVKYWIATGSHTDRKVLGKLCGWPRLDWKTLPPPVPQTAEEATA